MADEGGGAGLRAAGVCAAGICGEHGFMVLGFIFPFLLISFSFGGVLRSRSWSLMLSGCLVLIVGFCFLSQLRVLYRGLAGPGMSL